MSDTSCPLCDLKSASISQYLDRDGFVIECARCGRYGVSGSMRAGIPSLSQEERFRISCYTRDKAQTLSPLPIIFSSGARPHELDNGVSFAIPWNQIVTLEYPERLPERVDRSLVHLSRMAKPGRGIDFKRTDDVLLYAETSDDIRFILDILRNEGLITDLSQSIFTLTYKGWNRVAELEKGLEASEHQQAFVAMWFDEELNSAWEKGFSAAIDSLGFRPLRVDKKQHNEKICDVIVSEINRSRFLVADFTGNRGGVYYEAGYAKGLGIPVIFTCREDHKDDLHFDTRQYNHIIWKNEEDLRQLLVARILATIPAAKSKQQE